MSPHTEQQDLSNSIPAHLSYEDEEDVIGNMVGLPLLQLLPT